VALTPPEDGTIVRTQWRFTEFGDDPTPADREVTLNLAPVTVAHGMTSDFTLLTTVPFAHREVDIQATGREIEHTGVADAPVLAKYRFSQKDQRGKTTRRAAIGGVEGPTFHAPFSSDSVDAMVGTARTHQVVSGTAELGYGQQRT